MKAEVPSRRVSTEVLEPNRLSAEEYQKAANLVDEFSDVFAESSDDRGRTKLVTHRINTGDSKPIRQARRRLPLAKQPEVDKMMADMEKQGIIEPSNSPWSRWKHQFSIISSQAIISLGDQCVDLTAWNFQVQKTFPGVIAISFQACRAHLLVSFAYVAGKHVL
ncbi:unnamed protein product [Hermetia illucens]|uniref:Uncharacterized protein n=1 Tax=Hermetia illucens TaxID=343691 RepID=A0A7R8YRZ0_HERIL|nr:unnamed protein product [Hermetia illucens]